MKKHIETLTGCAERLIPGLRKSRDILVKDLLGQYIYIVKARMPSNGDGLASDLENGSDAQLE